MVAERDYVVFKQELSAMLDGFPLWDEDARMLCVLAWLIEEPVATAAQLRSVPGIIADVRRIAGSYGLHASRLRGKLWLENGTHKLAVPALEER